jgi:two-component system, cell cycle response regulator
MKTNAATVALVGFTVFEEGTFDAFFNMASISRPPGFQVVQQLSDASLVIVNGADPKAVQSLARNPALRAWVLLIGADTYGTGWMTLPRPIRLTAVLTSLSMLLNRPTAAQNGASPLASVTAIPGVAFKSLNAGSTPPPQSVSAPERNVSLVRNTVSDLRDFPANALLGPDNVEPDDTAGAEDILVVDDSEVALKFMQSHLGAFGFRVHLVKSGEECIMKLSEQSFRCVFLDVMMPGLDGYQTCRVIKRRSYGSGVAPKVLMMTSKGGPIDKVRGAMAGCDGYLVKPLGEEKLIKALFHHNVSQSPSTTVKMKSRIARTA